MKPHEQQRNLVRKPNNIFDTSKLLDYLQYEEGWDGYSASPFHSNILLKALFILSTIFEKCKTVPRFAPSADNEILLHWEAEDNNVALVSIFDDFCHAYIRTKYKEYFIENVEHIDFFDKILKYVKEI